MLEPWALTDVPAGVFMEQSMQATILWRILFAFPFMLAIAYFALPSARSFTFILDSLVSSLIFTTCTDHYNNF